MKKAIALFSVALCLATPLSVMPASAENVISYYDYDQNKDGVNDFEFELSCDTANKTCAITNIDVLHSYDDVTKNPVIPAQFKSVYCEDYTENGFVGDFTVTSVELAKNEESLFYESIEIPYSVNYITPETIGWYWDDDDWEYKKDTNVKIICAENTAAYRYATDNGFVCVAYKNICSATVTASAVGLVYDGSAKTTSVTVTLDGKTLVSGKDYTVAYQNNENAGTAYAIVTGIGEYRGQARTTYNISPASATSISAKINANCIYTGKAVMPDVTLAFGAKKLVSGKDYTISCINNIAVGTATAIVSFKGNFTGSKSLSYKIALGKITSLSASTSSSTSVKLSWKKVACTKYYVYRYKGTSKKYEKIAETTSTSYTCKQLVQGTPYYFKVCPVYKTQKGTMSPSAMAVTKLTTPKMSLATKNKSANVTWNKNKNATGYKVYVCKGGYFNFKRVADLKGSSKKSYTLTKLSNYSTYYVMIRSYRIYKNKYYYSDYSYVLDTQSSEALINGITLKSRSSYTYINTQSKKSSVSKSYLSIADKKTLKKFADTHFKKGMSRYEKLNTTLVWIHENITYASSTKNWNKISGKSFVDAIFNYRLGQCAQYNGAMMSMMTYLGYDVRLIIGYRGDANGYKWQHFWGEIVINGRKYCIETGNKKDDGWAYLVVPYNEASGYIENCKNCQ